MRAPLICFKTFFLFIFFYLGLTTAWAEELVIYFPTTTTAKNIENKIKEKISSYQITVFGKYSDFQDYIETNKPSYIIAPWSFSFDTTNYSTPSLANDKTTQELVLLTLDKKWEKKLNDGKLGIIATASREGLKKYTEEIFQEKFKLIKSVSKPDDLIPLLVFKSVDFVAITPQLYQELKTKFTLDISQIKVSKPHLRPTLFVKESQKSNVDKDLIIKLSENLHEFQLSFPELGNKVTP